VKASTRSIGPRRSKIEYTQRAGYREALAASKSNAFAIVHQDQISPDGAGEGYRHPFTIVQG